MLAIASGIRCSIGPCRWPPKAVVARASVFAIAVRKGMGLIGVNNAPLFEPFLTVADFEMDLQQIYRHIGELDIAGQMLFIRR